ncbi:polysaccharide biosynthesis tyrosine autokinase [Dysgonomonas sp. 521]|uniref:exopolysaccharide transport family protein n=1 Tax=Dysgonomonas sp. 521 TaxID=2302932 RepID=UPI0013CFE34E|nr:polysaccharide biosynthesis tyrosine autokinase [Dysgonomonas sp. 521]NDV97315.1 polysaccharide biosynthesis tyrosine autokinase [Dysgonomonas sp. 521]
MIENNKPAVDSDPYFEEIKSKTSLSFDFVLWFYRVLKYWYLFVISVVLFMAYAYIKNKSWVPFYSIQAMIILEDRGTASVMSGAVPLGSILRNTENQRIVLESYGLTERAVKNLPKKMHIDYYIQTRFKYISLYTDSPIEIVIDSLELDVKPQTYGYAFNVTYVDQNQCKISYKDDPEKDTEESFNVVFDTPIENKFFKGTIKKTNTFKPDFIPFSFRFFTNGQLVGMYMGRVTTALKGDNSTALTVSMYGTDPAKDIDYLTTLLDEFQDYNLTLKNQQADMTIKFLDSQIEIINDSLNISRVKLEKFQKETGVYEVSSQTVRRELDVADAERDELAMREKTVLLATQKIKEAIMGSTELIDPISIGLTTEIKLARYVEEYNQELGKSKNLGPKSPLYMTSVNKLNETRVQILRELQLIQVKLQDRKDMLVKKYQGLDVRLDNLPPQERDLIKYQREYNVNEMYHQFLTQRQYEAKIQRASNTPDNFIWEYPRMMGGAMNGSEKSKNYMYFFLIALVIPLIFVVVKEELLNFAITTKEECEKISGLPVIGTIENISKKLSNGVVLVKNYPKSSFAESFRNMRVRLEYMAQRENKITVLVTSTEPADGKTFIATNIASVYQLMGKKVIIVDLDLRRPSVAKTLQIDSTKGISNYLIGQVSLDEIIVSHPDYGFDIIPAGTLPPNPSELIKTAKTKQLLEHLKEEYDYVVIDCSPVGLVSDAYILSAMADTTLFVVRRAKTNKSFFKSVITQLEYDGVENLALVFNDVKGREGYYGTSRYYGDKTYYLKKNSYYHDDYFEN